MSTPQPQPDLTTAAVLFSRQFATLLCAGVSVVRTLLILEEEAPPPYAEIMPVMRALIEQGQTIMQAIDGMSALFPPFYRVMIHAGEVGGILDITLTHAADMLQEDWTLSHMIGTPPLLMTGDHALPDNLALMPVPQRTLMLLLFCRAWGSMLASGVPILQAMEVAAQSLPTRQRDEVLAAREVILNRGSIEEIVAAMPFLPPSAYTLVNIGMETGELDTLLLKAAELYRHQLVYQRQV